MNKEELVKEVSKKAKVSQKATADILAATLDSIQRTGRNPQTGATLKIAAKTGPAFTAGKKFKDQVK